MKHQPVRVIYIAGSARSGSTLLERMLSRATGMAPIGEARFIWERGLFDNQLCACGEQFRECAFWRSALASVTSQPQSAESLMARGRRLDSGWNMPRLLIPRLRDADFSAKLAAAVKRTAELFSGLAEQVDGAPIIDSSKSPGYLALLRQVPSIQLHVLHMVRDPRAVAFSRQRLKKRPEIHWTDSTMPKTPIRRTASEWMMNNAVLEMVGRPESYRRLRYESFVAAPEQTLRDIARWAGCESADTTFINDGRAELGSSHSVSGNPMRFQLGSIPVRLDDAWERELPATTKVAITALCAPMMLRYGYLV